MIAFDALLTPFCAQLNRLLQTDPQLYARVQALSGRCIGVQWQSALLTLYIHFETQGLRLSTTPCDADTLISGRLSDWLTGSHALTITGDLDLAHALQQLIRCADWDWEEVLAQRFGDVAGHQIARALRTMAARALSTGQTLRANTVEVLQTEYTLLPTPLSVLDFIDDVDTLRANTDRLLARIVQCEQH